MALNVFASLKRLRKRVNEEECLVGNIQLETSDVSTTEVENGASCTFYECVERSDSQQESAPVFEIITIVRRPSAWGRFRSAYLGIVLTLLASGFFSGSSLFVKLASSIPTLEAVCIRMFLQVFFSLPLLIFFNDKIFHPWQKTKFLLLRSIVGVTGMTCVFYSIKHMPLADARVLAFTAPVFTAILARLFLKESIGKFDIAAIFVSLGGVVLIGRPSFIFGSQGKDSSSEQFLVPTLVALLGAFVMGSVNVIIRKLKGEVESRVIVFYFSFIGCIVSALASLATGSFKLPDCDTQPLHYLYMVMTGILGYVAQLLVTRALSLEKAAIVSLTRTTGVVYSFVLQLLVLHVVPHRLSIGGASLVLLGNISLFSKKFFKKRQSVSNLD